MFGESADDLIKYLSPLDADSLGDFGFDETELETLLGEKADIVFSYLPRKYRTLYEPRVFRLLLIPCAYDGQEEIPAPLVGMSNIVGYLNPADDLKDFVDSETITITPDGSALTFSPLSKGDILVVDFNNDMSSVVVPSLAWATKVLAAIDIMAMISGEYKSGTMAPRIQSDYDKVFPWLQALNNSEKPGDRVIVRQLEHQFWEGRVNIKQDVAMLMRNAVEGLSLD